MSNENMTPEDVRDMKMRRRAEQAYNNSLTTMEMPKAPAQAASAPAKPASAPAKPASAPTRSAAVQEAIQEMQDAKARKKIADMGYAKGGSVKSSASRRADGIAQRGKTRGKMI